MSTTRRSFIKKSAMATLGAGALSAFPYKILAQANKKTYPISLAQFSFASDYFAGKADTLDFPALAKTPSTSISWSMSLCFLPIRQTTRNSLKTLNNVQMMWALPITSSWLMMKTSGLKSSKCWEKDSDPFALAMALTSARSSSERSRS